MYFVVLLSLAQAGQFAPVDGAAKAGTQEIQFGYLRAKSPTGIAQNKDPMGEIDSTSTADPMSDDIAPPISPAQTQVPRQAMQASPHPVVVTQPDGSKVVLRIVGGPTLNWQTDQNGYPVVRLADGQYVYAIVDVKGQLKATDRVVGKVDPAAAGIKKDRPRAPTAGGKTRAPGPLRKVESQPEDPMGDPPTTSPAQSKQTSEQPEDPMGDPPITSPARS